VFNITQTCWTMAPIPHAMAQYCVSRRALVNPLNESEH
jgi:hypothetical protein